MVISYEFIILNMKISHKSYSGETGYNMFYNHSVTVINDKGKHISVYSLALPLFFESIFLLLYGTVNTLMLSGYSPEAVSATSVAQQIIGIFTVILNMITKGSVILISINLGSKNIKKAADITGSGCFLTVIISLMFTAFCVLFSKQLIGMMNLSGKAYTMACEYLKFYACFFPCAATMSYFNNLLICNGFSKFSMTGGIVSNIVNIILSYIVLYTDVDLPFSVVKAVAVSAGLAQTAGMFLAVIFFIKKHCPFKLKIAKSLVIQILKFGIPSGMCLLFFYIAQAITTSFITVLGVTVINTKVYVSNIVGYTSKVSLALGNATSVFVGRYRGAEKFDKIKILYRQNLLIAIMFNITLSVLAFVFRRQLLSMFTDNKTIIKTALPILIIDIFVEIGRGVNHITENSLNANGDVKTTFITSVATCWACSVLLAYIFSVRLGLGLTGIWIAFAADEISKGIIYLLRWKSGKWEKIKIQ